MSVPAEPTKGVPAKPGKTLRKSLSQRGGESRFVGDPRLRDVLERAANPPPSGPGADERALTHGFHPWPGRLHPHTARTLIEQAPPGVIADPFMGAGTVPIEAMLAGREALGNDLNPIGVEVAWVRTRRLSPGALQALVGRARAVVKQAEALAHQSPVEPAFKDRVGRWFDAQALLEVWAIARCLREGNAAWQGSPDDLLTRVLEMVLSSILVKASRQVSDSVTKIDRRVSLPTPPGRVGHWFKKRASELADQLAAFHHEAGRAAPEPTLVCGDARALPETPPLPALGAVISSPPYPGVYDYLSHHQLRCAVLGLPLGLATAHEIGSRRATERLGKELAHARYVEDLGRALAAWTSTLVPDGFVALIIGDGQFGNGVVRVLPLLERASLYAGLTMRATLSQRRPTFGPMDAAARVGAMKEEHIVWLDRHG